MNPNPECIRVVEKKNFRNILKNLNICTSALNSLPSIEQSEVPLNSAIVDLASI
jgi:hypothetical protein